MTNSQLLPTKCANLLCLNSLGDRPFRLLSINSVMLMLCTPCEMKMQGVAPVTKSQTPSGARMPMPEREEHK